MSKQKYQVLAWSLFATTMLGCTKSDVDADAGITIELYAPGVREPATVSQADADIPHDTMIIGVTVRETHRAYGMASFEVPQMHMRSATPAEVRLLGRHIVNDLIDGVPITVTHCDDNAYSRVFVGEGSESLDLAICGRRGGQMNLQLYREQFLQSATDIPLVDYPFGVTTWGRWKSDHPDTDLYIGP